MPSALLWVVASCVLAAAGQVLLKLGSQGAVSLAGYANLRLVAGLALYGASTLLWIVALSRLPLSRVYPFTVLTFVLVYVLSYLCLDESLSPQVLGGGALVLAGLFVIATA